MGITDDLRKLTMAGLGAASVASEKTQEVIDSLAKRGEETLEKGKVLNERLQHNIKKTVKDNITVVETKLDKEGVIAALENLTPEELTAVRKKLDKLSHDVKANEQAK